MFVSHSDSPRPAVALVSAGAEEARAIAEHLRPEDLGGVRPLWLVCSVAGASVVGRSAAWRRFFHGGIFVEPHMPELEDFKDYFVSSLQVTFFLCGYIHSQSNALPHNIYTSFFIFQNPTHNLRDLMEEYKEEVYQCTSSSSSSLSSRFQTPCSSVPRREIEMRFHQDPYVSFVVKAVSALVAAFR